MSYTFATRFALLPLILFGWLDAVPAADAWPQFRGPGGQGHATATGLPLTWSETENVTWRTPIPGRGWSSPGPRNQAGHFHVPHLAQRL